MEHESTDDAELEALRREVKALSREVKALSKKGEEVPTPRRDDVPTSKQSDSDRYPLRLRIDSAFTQGETGAAVFLGDD